MGNYMENLYKPLKRERKSFARIPQIMEVPNLIEIQKKSYEEFLQKDTPPEARKDEGLQAVFTSVFPITDFEKIVHWNLFLIVWGRPNIQ